MTSENKNSVLVIRVISVIMPVLIALVHTLNGAFIRYVDEGVLLIYIGAIYVILFMMDLYYTTNDGNGDYKLNDYIKSVNLFTFIHIVMWVIAAAMISY